MTETNAVLRAVIAASVTATTLLAAAPASADDRELCASSAEQAQQLRDEGKYRRAREQMLVCARDVCPGPIKSDCGRWLEQLDAEAPTVVFAASEAGKDVADVKVSMDGALLTERLDGKPHIVDAGEHKFTFERGSAVKEERLVIRAGEKGRLVAASFTAAGAPPPEHAPAEEGSIVPALVVGGIGVIGLAGFAVFGLQGTSDVDDLQRCKPDCEQSAVDRARTKLILADISLGVGVVALGVATFMILTRPKVDARASTTAAADRGRAGGAARGFRIDAAPIAGGAAAAVGATF